MMTFVMIMMTYVVRLVKEIIIPSPPGSHIPRQSWGGESLSAHDPWA
jgi:hypothetical protein